MAVTWTILTPAAAPGAIAIVQLSSRPGSELDAALGLLGLSGIGCGELKVRDLLGVDTGVVARWSDTSCHLMPHGGLHVVRALVRALGEAGLEEARDVDVREVYPEAGSEIEARMLASLARAASPLAIDLLLDQPRRWAGGARSNPQLDRTLQRLIEPALVVAMGPANVGKSTLVNALAGRAVAIVADEPGTTRDHVGVLLDLGGVVVRYLDTPGIRETGDAIEREAQEIALQAAAGADLIVLLGDSGSPDPKRVVSVEHGTAARLTVALRCDMGVPTWKHDLAVSAKTGAGMTELVARMREAIVPKAAFEDARPWRFWNGEPG